MSFPDFTAKFCDHLDCYADLNIPQSRFTELKRYSEKRERGIVTCGVEFKGQNDSIHLYAILRWPSRGPALFVLRMHTFKSEEDRRETQSSKLEGLLKTLAKLGEETTLKISGSFNFPKEIFKPKMTFPDSAGLGMPLLGGPPIKVTGLRFSIETGPIESVILDEGNKDFIFVALSLTHKARTNEQLPEVCLTQASTVALSLVTGKS